MAPESQLKVVDWLTPGPGQERNITIGAVIRLSPDNG